MGFFPQGSEVCVLGPEAFQDGVKLCFSHVQVILNYVKENRRFFCM